jgi:predicted RNase H-like HicB family nuclease
MSRVSKTIHATIDTDETGTYVAECSQLNAVTQGATLAETLVNLREVIALALDEEGVAIRFEGGSRRLCDGS